MTENSFSEKFDSLIEAFCTGLTEYEGEVHEKLFSEFVKTLKPAFEEAIMKGYAFDILTIAEKLSEVSYFRVEPENILQMLLDILPNPKNLSQDEQFTLAQILDPVDRVLPGVLERLQYDWKNKK